MYDILLKNATVVDGTGGPSYRADVAVRGGKIAAVGELEGAEAAQVMDLDGLHLAPGFIDWHSHSDLTVLMDWDAYNILEQGITTEITGHCGLSIGPLMDPAFAAVEANIPPEKVDALRAGGGTFQAVMEEIGRQHLPTNMAFYMGHGTIRGLVMGYDNRRPTEREMEQMRAYVREGMEHGAMGLSTGLIYPPGSYSTPEEIEDLCRVVGEYGGSYTTHMRNESNTVVEAVEEAIHVAEACHIPVFISHHKIAGRHNQGKSKRTLELITQANCRGLHVGLDQYPYDGGSTSLLSSMPPWYASEGMEALVEKLKDPAIRAEIKEILSQNRDDFENLLYGSTFDGVLVVCEKTTQFNGMTLAQVAKAWGKEPYEALFDLLVENGGNVGAVYRMICEWDIENILRYPLTTAGIDGSHEKERGEKYGHPRTLATYPRLIGRYCREKKLYPLEECIYRFTGLAAKQAGFACKGRIAPGMDADLVAFDFDAIIDRATYDDCSVANPGIAHVFVNGAHAVKDGICTGVRGGRILARP